MDRDDMWPEQPVTPKSKELSLDQELDEAIIFSAMHHGAWSEKMSERLRKGLITSVYVDISSLKKAIEHAFINAGWNKPFDSKGIINFGTEDNPVFIHKDSLPFSASHGGGFIKLTKEGVYRPRTDPKTQNELEHLMSGQEWYDKFLVEYDSNELPQLKDSSFVRQDVFLVARKAAGIEQ